MKHYCVDCMNFLTRTLYKGFIPGMYNKKKIRNAVYKRGRATIFWCRITGAYYLNTHRIYELKACKKYFDDAGEPSARIKINIEVKRRTK